jgi:TatA/E family protein of Tat protein translocase
MFGFHWEELLIVLVLAMLFFGPKRVPELGGALGRGLRDFRKGLHQTKEEMGINEIQEQVHDVKVSVQSLPNEINASTRPAGAAPSPAAGPNEAG